MKFLTKELGRYTIGIWIALLAIILTLLAWAMQSYSLINWEGALELGLQNESFNGNPVEQALADVERGVALADIFWALPITIIALIGVLRKRLYGFMAAIILFTIPSLLGILGLWANRKLFKP